MKLSQTSPELSIILTVQEDGQEIHLRVPPNGTSKRIRCQIGHLEVYGLLYVEPFETEKEDDILDIRLRLNIPAGASDYPSKVVAKKNSTEIVVIPIETNGRPKTDVDGEPFLGEIKETEEYTFNTETTEDQVEESKYNLDASVPAQINQDAPSSNEENEMPTVKAIATALISDDELKISSSSLTPPSVGEEEQMEQSRVKPKRKRW